MPLTPDTFVPHPALMGGHRMTLYAWAIRRRIAPIVAPESRLFNVAEDTMVLGHCHWQPDRRSRPTVILMHGLEGSSNSQYMHGLADKALRRGLNVVRLNHRSCGGTEELTPGFYHSGLTADPLAVMQALHEQEGLERFAFIGYSLGGNIAMKLGAEVPATGRLAVAAVAAVSPPIELVHCVDALERASNVAYHLNFVHGLRRRARRKSRRYPERYDVRKLRRVYSVRTFDDTFTAPHNGFDGAGDYYHRASARRVIHALRVPALLVTSADDPFVPPEAALDPALDGMPLLTRAVTKFGGHCGYVGRPSGPGDDGYWAESTVVDFVARHLDGRG